MAYTSKHRFVPMSARKLRLVLDMVRGKPLEDALAICRFSSKRAAHFIGKVLKSARANALDQGEGSLGDLFVASAVADEGPTRKKWRPRSRGMAAPRLARSSHISIALASHQEAAAAAKE